MEGGTYFSHLSVFLCHGARKRQRCISRGEWINGLDEDDTSNGVKRKVAPDAFVLIPPITHLRIGAFAMRTQKPKHFSLPFKATGVRDVSIRLNLRCPPLQYIARSLVRREYRDTPYISQSSMSWQRQMVSPLNHTLTRSNFSAFP